MSSRTAAFGFNGQGRVENSYTLKIANMTEVPHTFDISVSGMEGIQLLTDTSVRVDSGENRALPTVVDVAPETITQSNNVIRFRITSQTDESLIIETESRFVGPTR